jgi:hypothetical protein
VDASVSRSEEQGAAAAFYRDSSGNYLGASAIVVHGIIDPATLESLACREAIALAEDLGTGRVCGLRLQNFGERHQEWIQGRYGPIIEEIKTRATLLQECSFVFEGQAVNFEAHNLARFATTLGIGRHLWLSIPYDNIPVNS